MQNFDNLIDLMVKKIPALLKLLIFVTLVEAS